MPAFWHEVVTLPRGFPRDTQGVRDLQLSRRQIVVGAVVVLAVLLLGSRLLAHSKAAVSPPIPTAASTAPTPAASLYVDVVGAVRRPGLYRLPHGSRTADALARAGGPTRAAQLELVNLAAPVADGEQVVVPRRGSAAVAAGTPGGPGAAAGPVHLNTATLEQLDASDLRCRMSHAPRRCWWPSR